MDSANLLAHASLFLWIPLAAVFFFVFRPPLAALLTLALAWMFLPERVEFDAPALPPFDKNGFAIASALVGAMIFCPKRLWRARPQGGLEWAYVVMLAGCVGTALTNGDVLFAGPRRIPSLSSYDAVSMGVRTLLEIICPFFIGKALFREQRDLRDLLVVLAAGAVVYSPLILLEARLSPQLNVWIYGFHQHSFVQTLRAGGYRPMVFMSHGLAVALFVLIGVICATALAKLKGRVLSFPALYLAPYLFVVLLICKSLGALLYGLFMLPAIGWLSPRTQVRIAVVLGAFVLIYPALKTSETFPNEALVSLAGSISAERAESLDFRFKNETTLVKKGKERPWFGWGGYSRGRVFDDEGNNLSVTDGLWIIAFADHGIFGFIGTFGLLVGPIFVASRRWALLTDRKERIMLAALVVICAVSAIDQLPNAVYTSFQYFLPGALLGLTQGLARARMTKVDKAKPAEAPAPELEAAAPRYEPA